MKRKGRIFCLLFLFVTLVGGSVAVFTAIDFSYLDRAPFWISWGFAVAACILAYLNLAFVRKGKLADYVPLFAYLLFVLLAAVFTYTMPAFWVVLLIELGAAAIMLFVYFMSLRSPGDDSLRQQKISFLRELSAQAEAAADGTDDADLKEKLQKLAADIRYSDPMSPSSAAKTERELSFAVQGLAKAVRKGKAEEQIGECEHLLKVRALACMNRK